MCSELDAEVEAFRTRPLEKRYPYVWLDAMYEKVREAEEDLLDIPAFLRRQAN